MILLRGARPGLIYKGDLQHDARPLDPLSETQPVNIIRLRTTWPRMRPSNILTALASLLSLAQARIFGVGVPSTIKPGDTFDLIVEAQDYIQSVTDVSIAVGYSLGAAPAADGLGIFITAFDLGNVKLSCGNLWC